MVEKFLKVLTARDVVVMISYRASDKIYLVRKIVGGLISVTTSAII